MNKTLTIRECADEVIEIMRSLDYKNSTISTYRKQFNQFINYCDSAGKDVFDQMTAIEYAGIITGRELTDLAIKNKKCQTREIPYLTIDQVKAILSAPDSTTKQGFRDKVLMTTLYDSAMRVDELIYMRISNVRLSPPATVKITGKGSKERIVPLMGNTAELLNKYIEENDLKRKQYSSQEFLFVNHSNKPLTRAGVAYIIDKYVAIANETGANITIEVHPHIFRHSKAVHLLEAGVELIYIRDILGHTSVKTTEIYARVCNAKKRAALEKAYEEVTEQSEDDWSKNEDLMSWLVGLSKRK